VHDGEKSEGTMKAIEQNQLVNISQRTRRSVTAELYAALEAVLPFAEIEVDFLTDWVEVFTEDSEEAERGEKAVATARRLIAMKSRYMRRKSRALREK
jgi:hypothetical protein